MSFSDNEIKIIVSAANKASPIFKEIAKDSQAAFREIEQSSQTHNRTLNITRENYKEIRKELMENNRYLKTLKMSYQDQTQTLGLAADAFSKLGNVVGKAQTMYTQYNVAMIKTNQLQKEVKDAQEKYNEAVAKFGPDSQQARKAQEELAESTRKLADAQKQNTLQLIGFAAQMPSFLKGILDMRASFMLLASQLKTMDWSGWASSGVIAIGNVKAALGDLLIYGGAIAAGTWLAVGTMKEVSALQTLQEEIQLTAEEMHLLQEASKFVPGMPAASQMIALIRAGKLEIASWGEEYAKIQEKIRKTPVVPGTPAGPTTTGRTTLGEPEDYLQRRLKEAKKALDDVTKAYNAGAITAEDYWRESKELTTQIAALEKRIGESVTTIKTQDAAFDDLDDTIKKTTSTKQGFESNLGSLGNVMAGNIGIAGNLANVFGSLSSAMSLLGGIMPWQAGIPGGMPQFASAAQFQKLGSWATGALQTAANIKPTNMIQTAAGAVTPMIQQLPNLWNWSQRTIGLGAQTGGTMIPAMLGMSNIPMVNKMLTGAMNMGILPPLPSLTNIVSSSVSPTFSNIGSSIVNSITGIGQSITNTLSSIFKPSVTAPPPLLPPTYEALQEGGIVTGPTWALLGEHGQREAVIPLPRGRMEAISEINVPISIRSLQVSNRREMTHFMREVERAIARESRYRSAIA